MSKEEKHFMIYNKNLWNKIQIVIKMIAILLLKMILIFYLVLNKNYNQLIYKHSKNSKCLNNKSRSKLINMI